MSYELYETNHRKVLAAKFETRLTAIINSQQFKDFKQYYDLQEFKFEVFSKSHRDEVIELCCKRLSVHGRSVPSIVTNMEHDDGKIRFIDEIDHAIKTGLSFVCIHVPTSKVAMYSSGFDILDTPTLNKENYSIKMKKRCEFMSCIFYSDPIYVDLNKRKVLKNINYGEIIEAAFSCSNPVFDKSTSTAIATFSFMLYSLIWAGIDSVKTCVSTFVHPKSVFAHKLRGYIINAENAIGYQIKSEITEFQVNKYLLQKMKSDVWYQENISESKLKKLLKQNYSMTCGVLIFDREKNFIDPMYRWIKLFNFIRVLSANFSRIRAFLSFLSNKIHSKMF